LLHRGAPLARASEDAPPEAVSAADSRARFAEFGVLETKIRQVRRPSCWNLVLRGRLINPYDEPVDGMRMIVRLRTGGEEPRELERIVTDIFRPIAPGESIDFNRELTTACTSVFHDISVVTFARQLGAKQLPVPSAEIEVAAAKVEESLHHGGGHAPIPNVGGWNPSFR
jgi:hypothetical protein